MLRAPRKPDERLFSAHVKSISLMLGIFVLVSVFFMFWVAGMRGLTLDDTRRTLMKQTAFQ
jgi:hypothetical protein